MSLKKIKNEELLFNDIASLIEESKKQVAFVVNATVSLLYWKIGKRINADLLQYKRAEYGKPIVATVSRQLVENYSKGFSEKSIRRMIQFAEVFPDEKIVASAMRQFGEK